MPAFLCITASRGSLWSLLGSLWCLLGTENTACKAFIPVNLTPILYHYPMSPFSEKLRLLLGLLNLKWGSVDVSAQPPRPGLDELVVGYRRIPVLQIGADIFCDTRIAYDALMALAPRNQMCGPNTVTAESALIDFAEGPVFFSAISNVNRWRGLSFLRSRLGIGGMMTFLADRYRMMGDAKVQMPSKVEAQKILLEYLGTLARLLDERPYLDGPNVGYTDLSCYHPLWMTRSLDPMAMKRWPETVRDWFNRVGGQGHGEHRHITQKEIEKIINESTPKPLPRMVDSDFAYGQIVTVAPNDYACEAVRGLLLCASEKSIVVLNTLASGREVHLHFPVKGFSILFDK